MLLARQMLTLLHEGEKRSNQDALQRIGMGPRWRDYSRKFRDALDEHEMFDFERSALVPVSDMRTDTMRGLSGLAVHVTRQPRRVFFDCKSTDLYRVMPDRRTDDDEEGRPGLRRGALLESDGQGRAMVQAISCTDHYELRDFKRGGLSKEQARFLVMFMNMQVSQYRAHIDTTVPLEVTPEEFSASQPKGTPRAKLGELWAMHELGAYSSYWPDPSLQEMREDVLRRSRHGLELQDRVWREELDGIFHLSLAMAATLELKDTDLSYKHLERKGGGGSRRARKMEDGEVEVRPLGLSVVTMHLSEEILVSAYGDAPKRAPGDGTGRARALHYVRGHMFLGRGGKVVYRKPHFRGQAGMRTLKRVLA